MTIREWLYSTPKTLLLYAIDEEQARQDCRRLLAMVVSRDISWLISHGNEVLTLRQRCRLYVLLWRYKRYEPMAYLLGQQVFYGRDFYVNRHTLIPRIETEQLITIALRSLTPSKKPIIVDIGTGSGCIAITLKLSHPEASVYAIEPSAKALNIAKKNAKRHHTSIQFYQDAFLPTMVRATLSAQSGDGILLCANLPYLPFSDKKKLDASVTRYEPHSALFSEDQGLSHIFQLINDIHEWKKMELRPITIILETDVDQHERLRQYVMQQLTDAKTRTEKDQCLRDRFFIIEC